jgi:hypothetical protein
MVDSRINSDSADENRRSALPAAILFYMKKGKYIDKQPGVLILRVERKTFKNDNRAEH